MQDRLKDILDKLAPATTASGFLEVGTFASGAPILQAYTIHKGRRDGPCLWINGSVHGTEINGILAALDFTAGFDLEALRGSVVHTPFANPLAIDARQKNTPQDGQDLDQTFPGNAQGQLSDRLSARIFAAMADAADLLVSMHTMGAPFDSKPYGVYKLHPESGISESRLLSYLRHFEPAVACRMNVAAGQGELPGNIAGAVDYQMLARGKPAFMVELGGGSRVQEDYVALGVRGLRGVAGELGMLEADRSAPPPPLCRVTERRHVMCRHGGLFRGSARPGAEIPAGEPVGRIVSFSGEVVETIRFDVPVRLIGLRSDPVVHTGDRVAFVATKWSQV